MHGTAPTMTSTFPCKKDANATRQIQALAVIPRTYLMKDLISTICSGHRNDHNRLRSSQSHEHYSVRTEKFKRSLSISPLIIIDNILSGILSITVFYLTFYVAYLLRCIVLYSVYMYRIVAIQPFGRNTITKVIHSSLTRDKG